MKKWNTNRQNDQKKGKIRSQMGRYEYFRNDTSPGNFLHYSSLEYTQKKKKKQTTLNEWRFCSRKRHVERRGSKKNSQMGSSFQEGYNNSNNHNRTQHNTKQQTLRWMGYESRKAHQGHIRAHHQSLVSGTRWTAVAMVLCFVLATD